jgi:lipopolysaccharide transport system permease protein
MKDIEYEIGPSEKIGLGLEELWEHRELLFFFTWRDIKVKYKQTFLGFIWAILQPTALMLIFTYALGNYIAKSNQLTISYSLFALSGLLLWGIFSSGVANAGNSMIGNANIIKKIYFPRLIIPISAILVSLFDFFMATPVFVCVLLYQHVSLRWQSIFLVPLSLALTCFSTFGIGIWLSALNLKFRDFRYVIPFFLQAMMFLSPVIFPVHQIANPVFRSILALNPMTCPLELFRSCISGYTADQQFWLPGAASALVLFVIGLYYFRRTEYYFADLA